MPTYTNQPQAEDVRDFRDDDCRSDCEIPVRSACAYACGYVTVYCGVCDGGRLPAHDAVDKHEALSCGRQLL